MYVFDFYVNALFIILCDYAFILTFEFYVSHIHGRIDHQFCIKMITDSFSFDREKEISKRRHTPGMYPPLSEMKFPHLCFSMPGLPHFLGIFTGFIN